ncbi:sulfatase family protein [Paenibacillus sedimenti]|uniref:Sulfatase-like hydrolase/transferase n=1 Tax=Paenibacillus sedimenti TaxID=2770274 RepID=A0A926QHQ1_9BACL|nr:sulfatase-like hydrolase/transferase [Paenibacillus sedimenti]MBD0378759.1 sulfatase-like hydrolase/transferase [Paenibacillus sedimenti]
MSTKPNLLLIFTDQQRWDTLGAYGNRAIHTPHLDRLAQEGAVFENAITPSPLCAPARACTMTGFAAGKTLVFDNESAPAIAEGESIAAYLSKAGYYSQAIGKMHFTPDGQTYGMDRLILSEEMRGVRTAEHLEDVHFDDYDQYLIQHGVWGWEKPPEIGYNELKPLVNGLPKELHITQWCGDRTVEWLQNERPVDRPFFLWTSFVKPHAPFDCPGHLTDLYDPAAMPKPWVSDKDGTAKNPYMQSHRRAMEADLYSEQALLLNRAYYYANITFIDEQIGRITQTLEEEGLADNTLVIFTSDHGELLGDHRLWFKNLGYEGSLHVPMIARWPGVIGPGTRCDELTTLLDIFPTFVNRACGNRDHDGRSGVDLLKLLAEPASVRRDVVCSEFYVAPNYMLHVRSKAWKYLFYQNGGYEELYHLVDDPQELIDLAEDPDFAVVKKELQEAAVQWIRNYGNPEIALDETGCKLKVTPYQPHAIRANPRPFSRMPWDSRVPPSLLPEGQRTWFWKTLGGDWSSLIRFLGAKE